MADAPLPPEPIPASGSLIGVPGATRTAAWRAILQWGRATALTLFLGIAVLGALVTPWVAMVLIGPAAGALFALTVALAQAAPLQTPESRRMVVYAAVTGVLLLPFAAGVGTLGAIGGAVLLVLFVVGALVAGDRVATLTDPPAVRGVIELRELVTVLPTARLLDEWRATEELLRRPGQRAVAAELRALLLDELARRDSAAVGRWLAEGGRSPDAYIRVDGDPIG